MHHIAEGFTSDTNPEFVKFLRYFKRSCTELQSELYMVPDQPHIIKVEFQDVYDHIGRTRTAIRGFINYLDSCKQIQQNKINVKFFNLEPLNP